MNETSRRGNIKQQRVKKKQAYATFMETAYFVLFSSSFFVQAIQDEDTAVHFKVVKTTFKMTSKIIWVYTGGAVCACVCERTHN